MSEQNVQPSDVRVSSPEQRTAALIRSRFNRKITGSMLEGAEEALRSAGLPAENVKTFHVPGAFELPQAAQYAEDRLEVDGMVTLGAVIRGETSHFDYICSAATDGLREVSLAAEVPVVFGILTCESRRQARERAGLTGDGTNKGTEAVQALLQMWSFRENVSEADPSDDFPH